MPYRFLLQMAITKTRVTVTLDNDIIEKLELIDKNEEVKTSTFVNARLRAFFKRPGKKYARYRLRDGQQKAEAAEVAP